MTVLILLITLLCPLRQESAVLARLTPYLTPEKARDHLVAARVAGLLHGEDPSLLLAVAWHESNFSPSQVTREPGGRVSCGSMTPFPKKRCTSQELTLLGGYLVGAEHLALWRRYYPREALLAYAGGGGLVRVCRVGPFLVGGRDICHVQGDLLRLRAKIVGALLRARTFHVHADTET